MTSRNVAEWAGLTPPYRTIVIDPPWPVVSKIGAFGRRARETPKPYSTMTLDDIESLPVGALAADPALLWLWITPRLNREGVGVRMARAWGFTVGGELVWKKPNLGMGLVPRMSHEIALVCTRGKGALEGAPRNIHSVQEWAQLYGTNGGKTHSAKPTAFFDLVQSVSPGPYVELFSRAPLLGWDHWGYGYEQVPA